MDILRPGAVKRKDRYQACLEHMNLTQASVAQTLDVDERNLIAYAAENGARANALTLKQRRSLAKLICGHAACEPWLTSGMWPQRNVVAIAPKWLTETKVAENTRQFVRMMTLAYHRSHAAGWGKSPVIGPLELDILHFSGDAWTMAYGNDKAWNPAWWEQHSPELAAADAETKAAFAAFLSAMKSCKIWHREFIELMPFEVGRAYEAFLWEQRQAISALGNRRQPRRKPPR